MLELIRDMGLGLVHGRPCSGGGEALVAGSSALDDVHMSPANRIAADGSRVLVVAGGSRKSLKAELRAAGLDGDLLTVDLAQVVSTWIGETEKNLAAVFDAAERSGAVLLFDEADALFGKRTEVSDSHDRYANLKTADLLKRLEEHPGIPALVLRTARRPLHLPKAARVIHLDEGDDE